MGWQAELQQHILGPTAANGLERVKLRGRDLQYVSSDLQLDVEVVLAAVRTHPSAIWFAAPHLQRDIEIMAVVATRMYDTSSAPQWHRLTDAQLNELSSIPVEPEGVIRLCLVCTN